MGGRSLLSNYGFSLSQLLSIAYPEFNFQIQYKSAYYKKSQAVLKTMLKSIFPKQGMRNTLFSL